jgi:hypothetical protein
LAIEGRAAWWALRPLFGFYTRGISHRICEGILSASGEPILGVSIKAVDATVKQTPNKQQPMLRATVRINVRLFVSCDKITA